jgi:hypothetical protein
MRKKGSTSWTTVNTGTLQQQISSYYSNGVQLYFRLAPVNGSGTNAGLRPSKEVSVTIPKKTAAPTISIDGSRFSISFSNGYVIDTGCKLTILNAD